MERFLTREVNNWTDLHERKIETNFAPSEALGPGLIAWLCLSSILLVFIIIGNLLTIIAVRTCRRLRAIISNLFICSLAISDLIVGFTLPFHLAFYVKLGIETSHILCMLRFFFIIFACCVSLLTLITIAIDRYIAVLYALHYRRFMTRRVAFYIITFNWLVGACVASIPMFWNHWSTASHCEYYQVLPSWYMVGMITPGFLVIWTVMLMLYYRIMKEASKQVQQMRNSNCIYGQDKTNSHADWKSIQIVVIIMGCFSICWLPYFIVACVQIFRVTNANTLLYKIVFSLAMMNSGINPIIYAWKNSNFRKAFSLLIRCRSPNTRQTYQGGEGSCGSHMPRHNSHISIGGAFVAPTMEYKAADSNNNQNGETAEDNFSGESEEIHELRHEGGVQLEDKGNILNPNGMLEEVANTKETQFVGKDRTELAVRPDKCETLSIGTSSSSETNHSTEECSSCGIYKSILRKSVRFKNILVTTVHTNKMIE